MRWRLARSGILVAIVTMIVFWILISTLARGGIAEDQRKSLIALAGEAANSGPIVASFPQVVTDVSSDTSAFVVLVEADGTVAYSTAVVDGEVPRIPAAVIVEALETGSSSAEFRIGPDLLVVAEAIRWEKPNPGVAIAAQLGRFRQEQLAGVQSVLAVSTLLTLLAAAIVSWQVAGRALRPLKAMVATTDEIARTGDISRRLEPARRKDEVESLTSSFNRMLDRLEESSNLLESSLERQRRFVADAGHELRTPLTSIRSNAGFLAENPEADETDRVAAISDVLAESERMAGLVSDLLMLARRDARRPIERSPVALDRLASKVAGIAKGDITVSGGATVEGDEGLLERLIWILVDNALRHGQPPVIIDISTISDGVVLAVEDHGGGISEVDRDLVFERFYRLDAARSDSGSGLGLAIASEIAAAHGGAIRAESGSTGGARFVVSIPTLIVG